MQYKNCYIILGVSNTANYKEIKAAYRNLAKKYHPDKNLDNDDVTEERFKEIQYAYAILSNAEKRKKHDSSFSYNINSNQQKQYHQYTGNVYQYAQQQAQRKKTAYNKQETKSGKPDKTEVYQLFISIIIAVILLYFIISYSV